MQAIINGSPLAYDDVGAGTPVVLIHGFPLCRRMWGPQVKALTAAGFRVITPDLRGFGESAAPAGPYSMSLFADDIIALLDHLGIDRAVIGGMSMGGYVLLNLLERYPGRATAALFLVTRAGADDDEGKARRTRMAHAAAEGRPEETTGFFADVLFAETTLRENRALVAEVRAWMEATHRYGLEGGLLAMRDRKDFGPDLPLLDLPALVIGAGHDRAVPLHHSEAIARALPQGKLCTIPDAGHIANLEQPEAFNRCLLEFLQSLEIW